MEDIPTLTPLARAQQFTRVPAVATKPRVTLRRPRADAHGVDARAAADVLIASRRMALPGLREPHSHDETVAWLRESVFATHSVWLAEAAATVVGVAARDGEWLCQLYVAPGYTGRGIGRRLLQRMVAERPQLSLYTFQRNAGARRFYERHGFVVVALGDGSGNEEGEPDVCYRRVGPRGRWR